jgi:hypothetical protein
MPVLPGSLGLTVIADGSLAVAADVRNNYTAIQTAVNALIAISANGNGLDGDPLVWDNTLAKWVAASALATGRPRAPRMFVSALAGGPPASPVDGDLWSATNIEAGSNSRWLFQYDGGEVGASKWKFLGGPPLVALVAAGETIGSTGAYVALATPGPSITLPRAGDYDVSQAAYIFAPTGAAAEMSYDIGATGAIDADSFIVGSGSTTSPNASSSCRSQRKTGLAAVTLTSKYKTNSGAPLVQWRQMTVTPVRIT